MMAWLIGGKNGKIINIILILSYWIIFQKKELKFNFRLYLNPHCLTFQKLTWKCHTKCAFIFTTFNIDKRECQSCIFIVKLLLIVFFYLTKTLFTDVWCICAIYLFKSCDIEVLLHHISISYRECLFVNGV